MAFVRGPSPTSSLTTDDGSLEVAETVKIISVPARPKLYGHGESAATFTSNGSSTHVPSIFSRAHSSSSSNSDSRPVTPPTPFMIPPPPPAKLHMVASRPVLRPITSQTPSSNEDTVPREPTPLQIDECRHGALEVESTAPQRQWLGTARKPEPEDETFDDDILNFDFESLAQREGESQPADAIKVHTVDATAPHELQQDVSNPPVTFTTTQLPAKPRAFDVDGTLRQRGQRKILRHKRIFQASQISFNGFLIFFTWYFTRYWYVLLPFISAAVVFNVIMVLSLISRRSWTAVAGEKVVVPETPESLVMIVPCYNETQEELTNSLDSLINQQKIHEHKRAIVIICDGKVRGPGMQKTTADYLLQDILVVNHGRRTIHAAYTAWDQQPMDIVYQRGDYKGVPYLCIVKQQNQGKRDSLILVRSFLYNFNRRADTPQTIMKPGFFDEMASFMIHDANIRHVDSLIGMDADTVFDDDCVYELLQSSRFPGTVGVAGYVAVDWKGKPWSLWRLYQNTEYTITQCLRRLHQGRVTHKVSCLPGACQLLKICEETCGDRVLLELFGYCPSLVDGLLKQIQATASEDRNHVCHMLTARPASKTRQALEAKAYTDVPVTWSVYLSQRRRWSLGATANDWLLIWAPGVQWFERILSVVSAATWFMTPFVFAAYGSFIYALIMHPSVKLLAFMTIMFIPVTYYLFIPAWHCRSVKTMVQFWAGLLIYIFAGPFCRMIVLCYSVWNIDQLGWGKTRKIVEDTSSGEKTMLGNEFSKSPSLEPESVAISQPKRNAEKEEASLGRNAV